MKFYLVAEIAELLRLSQAQVYALIVTGKLRVHRFTTKKHGAVRVSQQQLDDFLQKSECVGEVAPAQEPPSPRGQTGTFKHLDAERLAKAWKGERP